MAALHGRRPEDTAWEDGTFKLSVEFTEEYPNKAPTVKFLTKMFPPNSARAPAATQRHTVCTFTAARAHAMAHAFIHGFITGLMRGTQTSTKAILNVYINYI